MTTRIYQYRSSTNRTYNSAQTIVPLIIEFLGIPETVVDLGGGGGGWLKAFQERGTKKIHLIDHPSIQPGDLLISPESFVAVDLSKEIPEPIQANLAISTEFVEHIGSEMNDKVVDFLTRSSPVVLFSAAIPRQGGDHINEQRPSFWQNLFEQRGYVKVDVIRSKIIGNAEIPY